jgi:hypothetical protein
MSFLCAIHLPFTGQSITDGAMKIRVGALLLCAGAVLLHAPAPVYAQTVDVPVEETTPPELRDFRLDEPKPEATPPPVVAPPPITTPTPSETPARPTARPEPRERPAERAPTQAPEPAPQAEKPIATEATPAVPTTGSAEQPSTVIDAPPAEPAEPAATNLPISPLMPWGLALAALLIAAFIGYRWWWQRGRAVHVEPDYEATPDYQPSPPARLTPEAAPSPTPEPEPAPAPVPAPLPAPLPAQLETEFTPLYAQLSIANLTIAGRLSIRNIGGAALSNITVRSSMISAREGQDAAIAAFHNGQSQGHNDSIGSANAGEVIDVTIEIQSPRAELQSFLWTDRQFLAPILLINLKGESADGPVESRLSCLIGREASPPLPKMKPLPIDRGPKRFEGIGFRPVMS